MKNLIVLTTILLSHQASSSVTKCAEDALRLNFSHLGAYELCKNSPFPAGAVYCAGEALNLRYTYKGAISICSVARRPVALAKCLRDAIRLNYSLHGARKLCEERPVDPPQHCRKN